MIKICHVDDLPKRSSKIVIIKDTPVAVINAGGNIFAWDNRCPHRGASLGDGHITDTIVQCKFHLWEFDIERDCALVNDTIKIKSYPVEIIEGEVFIKI